MPTFNMLAEIFPSLLSSLITKTWDQLADTHQFRQLREAARERLLRDTALNVEVWNICADVPDKQMVVDAFNINAFNEMAGQDVPLRLFLRAKDLPQAAINYLRNTETPDARYRVWTAEIHTEVELFERLWHRLRVLKVRSTVLGTHGNLDYLMHLHRALALSLKST